MEASDKVGAFQEFFETTCYDELLERVRTGKKFIVIEFQDLAKFNPDLAESLLEAPEDAIKAAEVAVERFDIEGDVKNFKVRFKDLPESQHVMMRNIRSKHIEKLIRIEGIVRQKSDVRPQVTSAKFECPSCGNVINVVQDDNKFKSPNRCSCGRKGKFRLLTKELVDAQKVVLEEAPEDLRGGEQPKRLNIYFRNDLVSPMTEKKTNPGSRIEIVGIVKEVPITTSTGAKSTRFDLIMEGNYVEPVQEDYTEIELDDDRVQKIKALSEEPKIYDKLVQNIAPSIYGHDKVKEALLLQMMGGVKKEKENGGRTRGDIHVLLIGDPGAGKSAMLKRISELAPKGRYVSGASSTGAGLTASVVKDEFIKGYALEAGAMVLANKGIACIDELDKMDSDDRASMHECLEQQCFNYDTKITLADGRERKIGEFVEEKLKEYPNKVIKGNDCLILEPEVLDEEILTTDWNDIYPVTIDRVSKHKAPDQMYEVTFTNGRSIKVTPEHPVFCIEDGKMKTVRADNLEGGECVPVPTETPISGETQSFETREEDLFNSRASQHIKVPVHNDEEIYRIVGYLLSEGCKEVNRGKNIGVNFTNKDEELLVDFDNCMQEVFDIGCYEQERNVEGRSWKHLRYISRELTSFFEEELEGVLKSRDEKHIPDKLLKGRKEDVAHLLKALFEGDGHVSVKPRTLRIGYGSDSKRLVEQVQDLLLRFGIRSSVTEHKGSYKVNVTGYDNIQKFNEQIGFIRTEREEKVQTYLEEKTPIRTYKDVVRSCGEEIIDLMEKYDIDKVGNNNKATMKHDYLKKGKGISKKHLQKLVDELKKKDIREEDREQVEFFENMAYGKIGFERVKQVRRVEPEHEWTYDVTVEPHHTFISQAAVLHNTVTVSKANIQATLRSETTLLAAANPKFGRFDPYEMIAKQIDLPSTLINRFDLIFPIRDLPDEEKDEKMASFILGMHKEGEEKEGEEVSFEEIDPELLRDYIAYARQRIRPVLLEGAMNEIKNYFVQMRSTSTDESEGIRAIPISARQLEALVRLAEASAKTRLSDKVKKKDAERAIDLLHYCLSQIGLDPETGEIDIDRISTGISASQRSQIHIMKDIIQDLENTLGSETIPEEDIIQKATEEGIEEYKAEEILEGLKRQGDVFEPQPGKIQRM